MRNHHRVLILPRLSPDDYAAISGAAAAFLDTTPYSGFTTSLDALAVATPVVTLHQRLLKRYAIELRVYAKMRV